MPTLPGAFLGLGLMGAGLLAIPMLLYLFFSFSQFALLMLFLAVPVGFAILASVFGILGLALGGSFVFLGMPFWSMTTSSNGLVLPAVFFLSFAFYRVWNQRQKVKKKRSSSNSKSNAFSGTAPPEPTPEAEYLFREREAMARFDEKLFGSAARAKTMGLAGSGVESSGSEFDMPIMGGDRSWRRSTVLMWTPRDVGFAAVAFGVPQRVCEWLEREHVDGRVALHLTDNDIAELFSVARPPLTFGERKLLKNFLERIGNIPQHEL